MDAEQHQEIARCLFRESNDALFLFDPSDNRVVDVNPVALRLTGFHREAACAMTIWDLFSSPQSGKLDPLISAYRKTGFYHSREGFELTRSGGRSIPVNVSVSRIHTKPDPLGLVIARDVSERKRVEDALRESEARYRDVVEAAEVLIWTVDAEGRITSLNPLFEKITGWGGGDWIGRLLEELADPDDAHLVADLVASASRGESLSTSLDVRIKVQSGETAILEFLSASRSGGAPSPGVSGMARDVTRVRKTADLMRQASALKVAREIAETSDRAKSEFLAHISHEIRTPMTAILGFTDLLLRDKDVARLPSDRVADLRTIQQNGEHLLDLIDDILDISKIEAGKLRVELASCSPLHVTNEVVNSLRVRAEEKDLALRFAVTSPIPATILTDAVRLRQILINLLGNAIKFTDGGSIDLRVGLDRCDPALPQMVFEIQDTGIGMSEDEIKQLFQPFSRPSRDPSRKIGGTGLGLAISRRLAEMLGGTIRVRSEPGHGSQFTLRFPSGPLPTDAREWVESPPPAKVDHPPMPEDEPRAVRARILLAEDNPSIQRVTALQLQHLGATVSTANNGQEALDQAIAADGAGQPFDAVLMDMQMPVLDGYEATRQLRSQGFTGSIFALTAYAMAEDREECLRLGCDAHITKPVDWNKLADMLVERFKA